MNLREWALPVYTILIQMATGALLALWLLRAVSAARLGLVGMNRIVLRPLTAIWLTILAGLVGSHLHLSRPFVSFLAMANLGSSWLSREVLFTTLFFLLVAALTVLEWLTPRHFRLKTALGWFGAASGAASIFCMGAIYLLPVQPAWNTPITLLSFYATALLLGILEVAVLLVFDLKFSEMREPGDRGSRGDVVERAFLWFAAGAAAMTVVVLLLNAAQISWLCTGGELAHLSLELLLGLYRPLFAIRLGLVVAGSALLIAAVLTGRGTRRTATELMMPAYVSCLFVLIGEILGRFLFYATHIRLGI